MRYRITQTGRWVIVGLSGAAENNEPLKIKYLFDRWLTETGMRVIVNLKDIEEFGVWEMGLLTSLKKRWINAAEHFACAISTPPVLFFGT